MITIDELEEVIMQVCRENPYRKEDILDILGNCMERTDTEMPLEGQPPSGTRFSIKEEPKN